MMLLLFVCIKQNNIFFDIQNSQARQLIVHATASYIPNFKFNPLILQINYK
jgi:hypothetical protein